ncbi:GntR family transcriptional regulator [Paractinoplanes brasiliensis]|uniref:GntR family transcriptional regulator n=1 Tax=Paractinoplanes brasiliensis TaxID=52695 RepID=A0A4R6JL28_9ACTN|nr:GntR family transcriptional regulator [Actinoplanes brasiliensis]TDO37033.1 GntR family transcriptional regulator [Actinoplanes brasiliensis]GID32275.1 putative transcriptional regulator, GntR family protein [Actinoplanes brasiliensis]
MSDASALPDRALRAICDAIVAGSLPPGTELTEVGLAACLGVGRNPVRQALVQLEQADLVRVEPGGYTMVSPADLHASRVAHSVIMAMHELATQEAGSRLTVADLDAMRRANAVFDQALRADDVDAAIAADDRFHGVVVTASGNAPLRTVLEQFDPTLSRVVRLRFASLSGRDSVLQHERIVELLAADDVDGAVAATRSHWQNLAVLLDVLGSGPALA